MGEDSFLKNSQQNCYVIFIINPLTFRHSNSAKSNLVSKLFYTVSINYICSSKIQKQYGNRFRPK